jgi:predicted RNA polymerase sigma factor
VLQAAIAACHARAAHGRHRLGPHRRAVRRAGAVQPSPVVELNRAVAVGMAEGPAAGLVLVDALAQGGALAGYQWLPSVRGDLLEKLGRRAEAGAEFARAAAMATNARERALLLDRARANAAPPAAS